MRARLKDVAEKAGVAPNTASTILNRRPNSWASKETEERVFAAAKELGYRPSRAALGLRLGSFKTVGLVIPDLHNPVYTTFADLLEQRMREHGYDLIVEHSRTDVNYEKHCLDSILDRQIDAVTYFCQRPPESLGLYLACRESIQARRRHDWSIDRGLSI